MKIFYFKLNRHIISVLLGLVCATPLFAQTGKTVTGTVKDHNHLLSGVVVTEEGTQNSVRTDANGYYSLTLQHDDAKLIFEQLDFPIREEEVLNRSVINVSFTKEDDGIQLKDVVINAGYYAVKDKERTGSIARITAKEIENQPVNSILDALQGRVPGFEITPTSGNSGSGYKVRIRGQNSIAAGNDPLYIIDGVPFSTTSLGSTALGGVILPGGNSNPLNTMDPQSIESIEVLKDADATAIYGSRGANGVLLITTKKGKTGKTAFTADASTTIITHGIFPTLLNTNQYLEMRREAFANDKITTYPTNAFDVNGTWDQNRFTDWQKEFIGKATTANTLRFSVSGGIEQTSFILGNTLVKENAVYQGDFKYTKLGFFSTLNHQSIDHKFNLRLSVQYSLDRNFLPTTDLTRSAITLAPNAPSLYNDDGCLNWANNSWSNPIAALRSTYRNETTNLNTNAVISYQLLNGVTIKTNLGYQRTDFDEFQSNPNTMRNPAFGSTSAASNILKSENYQNGWIIEPQIDFNYKLGNGKVSATAGATLTEQEKEQNSLLASGFASNHLMNNIRSATTISYLKETSSQYRYAALYARINYQYKDRYILNLTGRRDGSSRFGPNHRFANFGAVGAAWIFSKENFLRDVSWLSFGKLRGSYGVTGNDQIGDYQFQDTFTIAQGGYDNLLVLYPTRLQNPNYSWEKNKKLEVALEVGLIHNRLDMEIAYYRNRSSNQLISYKLPTTTGFTSIISNLGAVVQNSGMEITLSAIPIQHGLVKWTTSTQLSLPQNKLKSFEGLDKTPYSNDYVIGESLYIRKLYDYQGIDSTTGLFQFKDYNQDGQITSIEDRKVSVDLSPQFIGSWQNSLVYKQWTMDFLFQFVKKKGYNEFYSFGTPGMMSNFPVAVLDRWQKPGDKDKKFQRYTTGVDSKALQAYNNFLSSTGVIEDASYIRLKTIAISYRLPIKELNGLIYIQGQNLWTLTKMKGVDPETERTFLPTTKRIVIGGKIEF